jgi:hypothetical protein
MATALPNEGDTFLAVSGLIGFKIAGTAPFAAPGQPQSGD